MLVSGRLCGTFCVDFRVVVSKFFVWKRTCWSVSWGKWSDLLIVHVVLGWVEITTEMGFASLQMDLLDLFKKHVGWWYNFQYISMAFFNPNLGSRSWKVVGLQKSLVGLQMNIWAKIKDQKQHVGNDLLFRRPNFETSQYYCSKIYVLYKKLCTLNAAISRIWCSSCRRCHCGPPRLSAVVRDWVLYV